MYKNDTHCKLFQRKAISPLQHETVGAQRHKIGSSRKVRETNREEPNEHKEETVISVAISKALGNFNLVIESLKFTC